LRRNADTSLTWIAGVSAGSSADGIAATAAGFPALNNIELDGAGHLLIADQHRIRMISGGTITTIAGSTTSGGSGDYGPATAARLSSVGAVGVTVGGHVLISDTGNVCVREVW
jgi:hypothetical protein